MKNSGSIILVRHAPSVPAGFLYGRSDPGADVAQVTKAKALLEAVRAFGCDMVISSPALRCRQTAQALMEEAGIAVPFSTDDRLWEQDFGAWDGLAFESIPDIGELTTEELVGYKEHGGESFSDVCHRVWDCLQDLTGTSPDRKMCIVAHAGVLRAASVFHTGKSMSDALMLNPPTLGIVRL